MLEEKAEGVPGYWGHEGHGKKIQRSLSVVLHLPSVEPTQRTLASEHKEAGSSSDRECLCSKKLRHNTKSKHMYMSHYQLPLVWPSAHSMTYRWGAGQQVVASV